MSEAVRLDRKPTIQLGLGENGLHFRMEARLHGDAEDWKADDVATFFMDVWEAARQTAQVHRQFGLKFHEVEPRTPERVIETIPVDTLLPPVEPPHPEGTRARTVLMVESPPVPEPGVLLDKRGRPDWRVGMAPADRARRMKEEQQAIAAYLWKRPDCEATRAQVDRAFPAIGASLMRERLKQLQAMGVVAFRKVAGGNVNFGFYGLTDQGKEMMTRGSLEVSVPHPLTALLPITKGKTFLMLGGLSQATRERIHSIEATFQLKELRWPKWYEESPIQLRLDAIGEADVDLVLCNRWNKRYSRHYQHHARECGKPFVMLTRGINPSQIAEQLRRQFIEHRGVELPLAA